MRTRAMQGLALTVAISSLAVALSLTVGETGATRDHRVIAFGVVLLVSLLVTALLHRAVSKRTHAVLAAARRLAEGDLTARSGVTGDDEVGLVAHALDDVAAQFEQRRHQQAEAEHRYRTIFEQAADAIFVADASGRYVDANRVALALVGYTLEELRARTIAELTAPEESKPRLEELRARGAMTVSRSLVAKSGERVPVELGAAVLLDGSFVSVARDLRPRFEADRLRAQVAANERLAVLGTLAAGVGHEINNPLTFVLDALDEVSTELTDERLRRRLVEARDGAERIARIVADLRVFARASDETTPLPVTLGTLVRTAVNLSGPATRGSVRVEVEVPESLPEVHADERRLCQVLLNLIQNATLAMPSHRGSEANRISLTARAQRDEVVLEVSDNGEGIAAPLLPRIFEPYFTTRGTQGTGLGLAISRDLLARMGASISVVSTVGVGTTFTITFRIEPDARPRSPPRRTAPPCSRRRVLIIDDEPMVARAAARLLREHELTLADSPTTGLERCREQRFDVILCDLSMPDGGGARFFADLKVLDAALVERVIFVTGGASSEASADFLEGTRQPVLAKPFDGERLRELVARVPERHASAG